MKNIEILSKEDITREILKSYNEYNNLFIGFQSFFLTGLYKRYKSIEKGNIVLFFSKETHKSVLRMKDYNFFHDISFIKFWENHESAKHLKLSIGKISTEINLPKETTRRNILDLIKNKILHKNKEIIYFSPNEYYKNDYNKFIEEEINILINLFEFIFKKLELFIEKKDIKKEIKKNFSFYWFHYLEAELKYLKECKKKFTDLELLLISKQCSKIYLDKIKPGLAEVMMNISYISESCGIPRATCLRKLEKLEKIGGIAQNTKTKRYFMASDHFGKSQIAIKNKTFDVIRIYSNFFYTCVRALSLKI